jgi:DNA-binding NarL/FixJ family response regulator
MATEQLRVLIVEDGEVSAEGLRRLLSEQPDMEVVGIAPTGQEALRYTADLAPDVVLMDLYLPDLDGLEATRRIAAAYPATSIIMVTGEQRVAFLQQAMLAGAQGYVLKPITDAAELANTIRTVRRRTLDRLGHDPSGRLATPLDRHTEEFLALVSHELRQPVAAIALTAEALHDAAALGPTEHRMLDGVWRQAQHLTQLAEDVLAVARLESAQVSLHPALFDLSALVAALARECPTPARVRVQANKRWCGPGRRPDARAGAGAGSRAARLAHGRSRATGPGDHQPPR